jgi:precorrin-6B C5,15-methyltransferase / cobalt-precorrin-6B C5,C15-methyltransferase
MMAATKPDPMEWCSPTVILVGLGTGREDLSVKVLQWLERAEVLAGGKRHLDSFSEFGGERILLEAPLENFFERLRSVSERRRTAVLASGDPFFFGIGRRLMGALGKERVIAFPNITSVQALFAGLGESWEDVKVLSLHGGMRSPESSNWLRAVRSCSRVALLTDPEHHPGWVARQLLDAGLGDRSLIVAEDLGLTGENIQQLAPAEAIDRDFSPLNLVVITASNAVDRMSGGHTAGRDFPVFGLPDSAFEHEAGMITKMEVRAVVLAHLQLRPGLVMWDLGAGSGSVSIEAARLTRLKQVVAVEKNRSRHEALLQNVKNLGCPEIQVLCGTARDLIDRLPDPDRVFIGGSGGELRELLQQVAERLRADGRVVQTAVTLDTLETVASFWRSKPFEISITQLQVNRSAAISESLRFEALNPVFIVSAWSKT